MAFRGLTDIERYWRVRCFALEVEWTCNVVSAALVNQGLGEAIVPPTARGVMQAARILNGDASEGAAFQRPLYIGRNTLRAQAPSILAFLRSNVASSSSVTRRVQRS